MPRLVVDSEGVIARVGQREPKIAGACKQPVKAVGVVECLIQCCRTLCRHVNRITCVMFTETRRSAHFEDISKGLAGAELAPDKLCLLVDSTETRHELQAYSLRRGGF